jgi:sortase (surface protein transpeptidase)
MRLNIPMLGVSLPVETVSVTRYGNLDMPLLHQWDGVGLYKEGTQPGYIGSAVIDGYLRRPDGSPAAFSNLGSLHVGDGIYILRTDGELLHFHVVNVESYAPDQTPTSELFNDTSGAYLNLIASVSSGLSGASYGESQIVVHAVLD